MFDEPSDKECTSGNTMDIADLIKESYGTARSKGWWPQDSDHSFMEKLMLVVGEISEASEEYRKFGVDSTKMIYREVDPLLGTEKQKPEGIAVELADAVIRIADLCGYWGIPLEEALRQKMIYNRTRPFRHGGKVC